MFKDTRVAITLFLLVVILFAPILLSTNNLIYGTDINYFYPHETIIRHSLKQDAFPLWNPYFGGGSPQLGKIQVGFLYPPSVILRTIFPIVPMFNWDAVIHVFLAGLGIYMLLRDLEVRRNVSMYCATIFMFSGTIMPRVLVGHVSVMHTVAWMGWVLFAYRRLLYRSSWDSLLLTVLFASLTILGGHPQFSIIVLFIPVSYFYLAFAPIKLRAKDWKAIIRGFSYSALGGLLVVGLLAVQLIPFVEWLGQTSRGKGAAFNTFEFMTRNSLNLEHLLTPIFPFLWFDPTFEPLIQAGINISGRSHFWEVSPFVSISALTLMFISVKLKSNKKNQYYACYFVGLMVLGLVLSMGQLNPLYQLIYNKFPYFRAPGRFIILWIFSLTILIGLYTNDFSRFLETPAGRIYLKKPAYLASLLLLIGIALTVLWATMGGDIISNLQSQGLSTQDTNGLLTRSFQSSFVLFTITMSLISALLWIGQQRVAARWWELLVFAVIFSEMLLFASRIVKPYSVNRLFQPDHPLAQLDIDSSEVRFPSYRTPPNYLMPTLDHGRNGEEYYALQSLIGAGLRGVHLLSAGYIASAKPLNNSDFELLLKTDSAYLYRHNDNLPRIYAAPSVEITSTDAEALAFVTHDSFAASEQAAVTIPSSNFLLRQDLSLPATFTGPAVFTANYLLYENDSLSVQVKTDRPVMVVLSEMFYPGWLATVDGQPVVIWKANYAFRGIIVAKGEHLIAMHFRPPGFRLGLTITLVTAGIILFNTIWIGVRAARRRSMV